RTHSNPIPAIAQAFVIILRRLSRFASPRMCQANRLKVADGQAIIHPIKILIDESIAGHVGTARAGAAGKRWVRARIVIGHGVTGDVLADEADGAVAKRELSAAGMATAGQMRFATVGSGVGRTVI